MVTIGVLVFLLMWPILGFMDALVLGLIAGVLESVPFLGPLLSAVPGLLLALGQGGMTPLWVVLAYLSAFLDFQNDGLISVGTLVSATGPAALTPGALLDLYVPVAGAYTLTVAVQEPVSPVPAARFRFTNEAGEGGGASPYGLAQSGEVEDYVVYNATLPSSVDVSAYALRAPSPANRRSRPRTAGKPPAPRARPENSK
jgi:hypothetical protein